MIGQTISHYKITDKLGAGGMGVVYKALDLKLERTVALKFLPHEVAISEQDKESLLREARAASALDHPNAGVVYGIEESGDHQLYIVMGYYEGETLARKLSRGLIPVRESLDLAIQIASGLSAAHARNIIHRDIKPSNIIITNENVAKIVDFGLARVVASLSATQSLQISGTLPYMAPEQVLGEPVDQRCDIWALGVIFVEMLTASHPFLRENTAAMTFAILNQPPAALDVIPPLLQPIAYRALSKKPEHRYPSAKEMLADLKTALLQITSSPASMPQEPATLTNAISPRDFKEFVERASTPRWQAAGPQQATSRRTLYVTLAVLLFAAASLAVPQVRERLAGMLTSSGEKHIAVLPFDNIGNDPSNEVLAAGLMDSLTSKLSNLDAAQKSLWVVPSSVVRSRKISDPAAAGKELGANLVVKGSIQRQGQDVQMTVNLIDAKTLRQVGSAALEERTGDLAMLQNEAVSRLARLMNINVSAALLRDTGGSATPAAYESYLKALGYMQRYDRPGNLDQAISALNSAVQTDPRFALGYAQLGEAYRLKNQVDPNPKWIDEATANCMKSTALDDHLPTAYVTLGRIHIATGKQDLALQEFHKALQLDARSADALSGTARANENAGRVAEAEAAYQKAAALRADYWDGYNNLGWFYFRQRRYAEALAQFQHVIQLTPDNAQAYSNLGVVYLTWDKPQEAESAFKKSVALAPSYAVYANLGALYYNQKRYAESALSTEKALQLNDKDFRLWANQTNNYRWLGQNEKALASIQQELKLLEEAARLQTQDAGVQSELARVYAIVKQRDNAITRIQAALALAPDDPGVLENVGEAYEELGNRREALRYVQKGLQKGYPLEYLKNDPAMPGLLADPNFRFNGK